MSAFADALFFAGWFGLGVALLGVIALIAEGGDRG